MCEAERAAAAETGVSAQRVQRVREETQRHHAVRGPQPHQTLPRRDESPHAQQVPPGIQVRSTNAPPHHLHPHLSHCAMLC